MVAFKGEWLESETIRQPTNVGIVAWMHWTIGVADS